MAKVLFWQDWVGAEYGVCLMSSWKLLGLSFDRVDMQRILTCTGAKTGRI